VTCNTLALDHRPPLSFQTHSPLVMTNRTISRRIPLWLDGGAALSGTISRSSRPGSGDGVVHDGELVV
jgi:hypothetical protein